MGIDYRAMADWQDHDAERKAAWYQKRGKPIPGVDEPLPVETDFDDDLECLRLSYKVAPLPPNESARLRFAVETHGFAAVLRSLYMLAYEAEKGAMFVQEFQLDAPDAEPFKILAEKLDELAGSREAALK